MKEKLSNGCISIAITVTPFAMLEPSVCSRETNISRVASVYLELYYEQHTPIIGGIIYHVPDTYEPPLPLAFSSHIRLAVACTDIAELAFLFQSGSNTVGIGRGKVEVITQVGNRDERLSGE